MTTAESFLRPRSCPNLTSATAFPMLKQQPLLLIVPGVAIVLLVLSFTPY